VEPFGIANVFGEAYVLLVRGRRSSLVLLWLVKRFSIDLVDATVFGEHCGRSAARVARSCVLCVPPPGVLHVLWCFRCALSLFSVYLSFPLRNRPVRVS
jgi:hypothetical protein